MALAELMLGARDAPVWEVDGRDWPNRAHSRFVEAGGLRWHVQRMGAGPTLLLLHGTGAATHSWRDLLPRLAERFDVVAVDLPGHGFTSWPSDEVLSIPAMSSGLAALLGELRATPAGLVGHSAGAALALNMAMADLCAPAFIVGLDAALTPWRGVRADVFPLMARAAAGVRLPAWWFARNADAFRTARLLESVGSRLDARGVELYRRLLSRAGHVGAGLRMMADWRLEPVFDGLPRLGAPLTLAVGEHDSAAPPDQARAAAERTPGSRLEVLEGLGHLAHEEAPARAVAVIEAAAVRAGVIEQREETA